MKRNIVVSMLSGFFGSALLLILLSATGIVGAHSIKDLAQMRHGQAVTIGGIIVARQHPPTAKGFAFLAVEDSDGMVNVVVSPDVYAKYRTAIHAAFAIIEGVVQRDHKAINVIAKEVREV